MGGGAGEYKKHQSWSFEKINKLGRLLDTMTKEKIKDSNY